MSLPARLLEEIAERFGTPFYVYDLDAVEARVEALLGAVGPRFEIAYAVKANPSLGVLTIPFGTNLRSIDGQHRRQGIDAQIGRG